MIPDYRDIVFVNGCFDVLHYGHVQLLEYARSLGSALVVGIDSDSRVASRKPGRPINKWFHRAKVVSALRCVDSVYAFNSDEELEMLINYWRPQFLVVGADWKGKKIVGAEYAREVRFFERYEELSSTSIIDRCHLFNQRNEIT